MATYYTIWTRAGRIKEANHLAGGPQITLTHLAVGDGGDAAYEPNDAMTALVREVWRGGITRLEVDPTNPGHVIVEAVLPTATGGWTVREAGLIDSAGDLIAIAKMPETYKPQLAEGAGKELLVRIIIEKASDTSTPIRIDPAIATASRAYVDAEIVEVEGLVTAEAAARESADNTLAAALAAHQQDTLIAVEALWAQLNKTLTLDYYLGWHVFTGGIHNVAKPGMGICDGRWIESVDVTYPQIWDYLQTEEGQFLCVSAAEYAALNTYQWHTNADGTKVGFDGVGGVAKYCLDIPGKRLRLPDLRGMMPEAFGCDLLGVGEARGDEMRDIRARFGGVPYAHSYPGAQGAMVIFHDYELSFSAGDQIRRLDVELDISRVVPTGSSFAPRRWGALACVYLGRPAS